MDYDYLWLLWGFSKNKSLEGATVRPPRLGGEKHMGVFATRAPYRPNNIGLSSVKLIELRHTIDQGTILVVSGVDMLDGSPIYDKTNFVLSEHQNSSAFMMRGHEVPQLGMVEELTSAVDIYPTLGKCLGFSADNIDGNLPASFGGNEREYTVSMSMYPPSSYNICLRTSEYECQASSRECIDEDGRADLSDMKVEIYSRENGELVDDVTVNDYFQQLLERETREIDNHGTQWPNMRAARPEWFAERN